MNGKHEIMRVLNLYAGLGGNRKHWTDVEVTAIENDYQIAKIYDANFPDDKIFVADAHQYLLEHFKEFDFIWSSPPCQSHSKMMKATRHDVRKYPDMTLYQEIIWLKHFFKGLWVVENVVPYYTPLIQPEIQIDRHLFWSNFKIPFIPVKKFPNLMHATYSVSSEKLKEFFGIHYEGNIYTNGNHHPTQALRNCVHPEIGLHIMNCAMNKEKITQKTIFD